jgi:hypothetical protein
MATTDFHQRKQLQADAGLLFTTHIEGVLMKRMRPLGFTHQIKPYASKPLILCGGEELKSRLSNCAALPKKMR